MKLLIKNQRNLFLKLTVWLLTGIASLIFTRQAQAKTFSLSISPPLLEVMIQPGRSITQAYEIKNTASAPLYLQATIVPFAVLSENGQIIYQKTSLLPSQPQLSLNNASLQLGQTFKLGANQSQQLILKIRIPQKTPEADYYYTLFLSSSLSGNFGSQTGSSALAKIGSHILITVSQNGTPILKGAIGYFRAAPKIADLFDSVQFKITAINQGKAFFKTSGKITIYDWLGKKRQELKLRPDNVLANSQRQLVCLDTTQCAFSSLFPGRYRAVAAIFIGNSKTPISQTLYFYLLPLKFIAALIISTIILLFISKRIKKPKIDQ